MTWDATKGSSMSQPKTRPRPVSHGGAEPFFSPITADSWFQRVCHYQQEQALSKHLQGQGLGLSPGNTEEHQTASRHSLVLGLEGIQTGKKGDKEKDLLWCTALQFIMCFHFFSYSLKFVYRGWDGISEKPSTLSEVTKPRKTRPQGNLILNSR